MTASALRFSPDCFPAEFALLDEVANAAVQGFKPDYAIASYDHSCGIDHASEYDEATGRPIATERNGSVIRE